MKRIITTSAFAALALGLMATEALAVPVTTSFTARIEDSSGPINGLVNLTFTIYDADTSGNSVWTESQVGVMATDGLVYVALGSVAPTTNGLDETVFTGGDLWLEVSVNGDVQSPRLPITSVPYAVHSAVADNATNADHATNADTASTANKLGTLAPGDVAKAAHTHTLSCTTASKSGTRSGAGSVDAIYSCTSGVVTGGGCYAYPVNQFTWLYNEPYGNGWRCYGWSNYANTSQVVAYARCCTVN